MRKAFLLSIAVIAFIAALQLPVLAAVAIEVPDSITGFFVTVTTSILDLLKEAVKQVLISIANAL